MAGRWRKSTRRGRVLVGAALAAAALGAGLAAIALPATTTKPYHAAIAVSPLVPENNPVADPAAEANAGSQPTVTITLTNDSSPQTLGSSNIQVPTGITLDSTSVGISSTQTPFTGTAALVGGVLQLRNMSLAPGKSVRVSATATMECNATHAPYTFTSFVKQSNDFNGTGNDFVITGPQPAIDLVGQCSLAFLTQPASEQKASDITGDVFLPLASNGHPVQVQVLDGGGVGLVKWWSTAVSLGIATNPGNGTLSGTTSANPQNGVATFSGPPGPRIDASASGYQLNAASTGILATPPKSSAFDIVDSGQRCKGGVACRGTTSKTKDTADVSGTATNDNDLLIISLGAPTAPAFDCTGYTATTDTLQMDFKTLAGGATGGVKSAIFTLLAAFVTQPANKYVACYRSTTSFTTRSGTPATGVDTNGDLVPDIFVGQLPTCANNSPVPPCATKPAKDAANNVFMTILTPSGDPWVKF